MYVRTLIIITALVHIQLEPWGGGGRGLQPYGVPLVCPEVASIVDNGDGSVDAAFATRAMAEECASLLLTMDGVRATLAT